MAKVLQHRRGTTAEHSNFTGAAGEITFDTTAKRLVAHDGATKGGIPVATKQEVEQVANSLDPRILDAASQADILEAVGQLTGGSISQPTLESLQSQISANASNIVKPVRYVVETWSSGTEWYTKYNDGWIEQGGSVTPSSATADVSVTLNIAFSNTNYLALAMHSTTATTNAATNVLVKGKTVTGFTVRTLDGNGTTYSVSRNWVAYGY